MALHDLCLKLDETLIECFGTLDQIYASQQEMEDMMKDGYFLMAKARYSMGVKAVGTLQYNVEDVGEAMVHVGSKDENGLTTLHMETASAVIGDNSSKDQASSTVRQRKPGGDSDDIVQGVQNIQLDNFAKKKSPAKDPIKWFGLLVPQALRQSQARFKRSIELGVDIANLQARFNKLSGDYKQLLKEKKAMKLKLEDLEISPDVVEDCSPNIEEYDFVEKEEEGCESHA